MVKYFKLEAVVLCYFRDELVAYIPSTGYLNFLNNYSERPFGSAGLLTYPPPTALAIKKLLELSLLDIYCTSPDQNT